MKKLKFVFSFLCISFLVLSCSSDDDGGDDGDPVAQCTQTDWIGTYTGNCGSNTVIVTVAADGPDGIEVNISSDDGMGTIIAIGEFLDLDTCSASTTGPLGSVDAMLDEGTMTITSDIFNILDTCNETTTVTKN